MIGHDLMIGSSMGLRPSLNASFLPSARLIARNPLAMNFGDGTQRRKTAPDE
jgi:hypothetical protein